MPNKLLAYIFIHLYWSHSSLKMPRILLLSFSHTYLSIFTFISFRKYSLNQIRRDFSEKNWQPSDPSNGNSFYLLFQLAFFLGGTLFKFIYGMYMVLQDLLSITKDFYEYEEITWIETWLAICSISLLVKSKQTNKKTKTTQGSIL